MENNTLCNRHSLGVNNHTKMYVTYTRIYGWSDYGGESSYQPGYRLENMMWMTLLVYDYIIPGENMKKRVVRYDFMRVLMSLFVICVHTGFPSFISSNNLLNNSIRSFLVVCNGVFFMISGKFNLRKNFESKSDYYNYYTDKFISIIVPYGIISCILVKIVDKPQGIKNFIYLCIQAFFSTNCQNHFWFMCCLIGMLVSAPFLAKMLNSMKKFELKLLFSIGIIWSIIAIY